MAYTHYHNKYLYTFLWSLVWEMPIVNKAVKSREEIHDFSSAKAVLLCCRTLQYFP